MQLSQRLYLDHAATAPLLPEAKQAMAEELAQWANPSSPHADGRAARARLEDARKRIAAALDWPHEVILTSGSSEAIAIALNRSQRQNILVSPVEHDAVLRMASSAERLPVDANGTIVPDALSDRLEQDDEVLIAVQHVNNETGAIQPVDGIAELAAEKGAVFFCDASQAAGKIALPKADLIALAAHKFGGPPGVGALLIRDLGLLHPSGGQEKGYRGGTENLPAAAAMAAALEADKDWLAKANMLRSILDDGARNIGIEIIAETAPRLATIGAYRLPGMAASAQLIRFDMAGISISAGSACSSGTLKTSHVLSAMGLNDKTASEVVRISIGPDTREADIHRVLDLWAGMMP